MKHLSFDWIHKIDLRSRSTWRAIFYALRQPIFLTTVLVLLGLWGFIVIAGAIDEQAVQQVDRSILRAMRVDTNPSRLIGPAWMKTVFRDLTALGGFTVLTLITFIVAIYLWLARRPRLGLFTLAAVVSGTIVAFGLKALFDRSRPDLVPHILTSVGSASFPSGHAMGSAIVYLTLATMLAENSRHWSLKIYVMVVAAILTLLVGVSRVALGVHYPTDVLAGWTAGFVWAFGCRTVVRLGLLLSHYRSSRAKRRTSRAPTREKRGKSQ